MGLTQIKNSVVKYNFNHVQQKNDQQHAERQYTDAFIIFAVCREVSSISPQ